MKEVLYEVRCLNQLKTWSSHFTGQFKQLSLEPEKFRWLNGIRTHDLCDAGAVLLPTELWSHTVESRSICWARVFPWKECSVKEVLYEVRCLNQLKTWSSHFTGQFKQLSLEPEKFRWLNGIRTHDLCDAGAVLLPTELWSHTVESRSICWAHVFPWKECSVKEVLYEVRCLNQLKTWSSHFTGQFKQLSLEPEKFRWLNGIWTHDLCDAGAVLLPTELWSHTVESRSICWAHVFPWKECSVKVVLYEVRCLNQLSTAPASQRSWVRIPLSHLNFSGSRDNCLNCPVKCEDHVFSWFKHRTSYNTSFTLHSFHGKTWAQHIDLLSTVWLHSSVGKSTAPASQRSWVRIPLSHLNFSGSRDNCLNCPVKCEDHVFSW